MTTLMDRPAYEVMQQHGEFDKIARGICLERGSEDYLAAVEDFTTAWENARAVNGPGQTVRQVLGIAGVNPAEVEAGVRLLERRDTGLKLQLDADMRAVTPADVPVNPMGQVMVTPDADMGALMVNPEERERRLARMRKADPRGAFGGPWDGEPGRKRFDAADKQWLEAGTDLPATAERANAIAAAKAKNADLARQVDGELREAISHQAGVKALDDRLAGLAADTLAARAQRAAAAGAPAEPGPGRVFLLESQAAATASGDFARERAYLRDELGLDADTVKALESYALANQPRHPVTGRFVRAQAQQGRSTAALPSPPRADDGLAAQLAAGGTIDSMGKVTPADPAGRSGLDVPGAGHPLAPASSITRAGFDAQVQAQMARNGKPWATAAREVAGVLAPQMNSDDLAATGVLTGPA